MDCSECLLKSFQGLANTDAIDFEPLWAILVASLREIHFKNASLLNFEELYRHAYRLVLKRHGETLYQRVKDFEHDWLVKHVKPRVLEDLNANLLCGAPITSTITTANEKRVAGEKFLAGLKRAWQDHHLCMGMSSDVLMYMERVYCQDTKKPKIFDAAMAQFRDLVFRAEIPSFKGYTVATVTFSIILDLIRMQREGDVIDITNIRACVYMLEALYETDDGGEESTKLYLTSFEPVFLAATRNFYRAEGVSLLQRTDAGTFCRYAKRRATEEQDRCRSTLSMLSSDKVKLVLEHELIKANIGDAIQMPNSGVAHMLDNDQLGELELIYDLISRVDPKKEELKKAVQKRIVESGTEINKAALTPAQAVAAQRSKPDGEDAGGVANAPTEKPPSLQSAVAIQWVDDVLQLKGKYDHVLEEAFANDHGLQSAFTLSFTTFINKFERCSEYLSLFFDENMKKGIKGKTENEVDSLLDRGITLLRYIQDKDMFERYYKKHLSRRLLMKRCVSMDAERQMISKMKVEVGNAFTQRLEGMFRDMDISEDETNLYKKHVANLDDADPDRPELDIYVLTSTNWPLDAMGPSYRDDETQTPACIFPSQIQSLKQSFEQYYHAKHNGRKLSWQANMGTADIRTYFKEMPPGKKMRELNVSTYAMVILLLFNGVAPGASLTCEEIQARTNIPWNELNRNLQSLAVAPKTRILLKEPMSKEVRPTDKLFFNEQFQSKFARVKIGVIASGNKVEEPKERVLTEEKLDQQRSGMIDAAIVRIM
ncbi:MAG: hypothetical protein Q9191_002159, partial [Dirinaria sp. TL-2023a]